MEHTSEFYKFYREKLIYPDVKPNKAHYALAELEKQGKLRAVVTQNVDGLHQLAGSKNVLELHGSAQRNYCVICNEVFPIDVIIAAEDIPKCSCGGTIRPDVVLFEEGLNQNTILRAVRAIERADVLIVGGTSLNVYPAAGLIEYYQGNMLILINKSATPYDRYANLVINDSIGKTLDVVVD
jgi:NAD-dependent deacetylase